MARIPLMQTLKEQTAPAHALVEVEFSLSERLASRAGYVDLLHRLYAFHYAWEEKARVWIDPALLAPRRKAHLLAEDIAALGGGGAFSTPRLDFIDSGPAALGAMYVVEGSMLGGALIAKEVEQRLGLTRSCGCAFFRAYGSDLAVRWRAFGAHVNAHSTPETDAAAIAAANAMFETMRVGLRMDSHTESSVAA